MQGEILSVGVFRDIYNCKILTGYSYRIILSSLLIELDGDRNKITLGWTQEEQCHWRHNLKRSMEKSNYSKMIIWFYQLS